MTPRRHAHPETAGPGHHLPLPDELDPRAQSAALERLARGADLAEVLNEIARGIETQVPGVLCSILVLDRDTQRLHHGAAPSLPKAYSLAIDGVLIGQDVGSCGTAAHRGECIVSADISVDPRWRDYSDLALAHELRACWSQPIFSTAGDVLGTFAMYYRTCRAPAASDLRLIENAANLAGIAIERKQNDALLRQAHDELESRVHQRTTDLQTANRRLEQEITERKEAEHTLRLTQFAIEHSMEAAFWVGPDGEFLYVNQAACRLLQYSRAELLQLSVPDIDTGISVEDWPNTSAEVRRSGGMTIETSFRLKDGSEVPVEIVANYFEFGGRAHHCAYARDVRPRKRAEAAQAALEKQLRHAQKLEAVGELASGVAHEFNNLLLIIGAGVERVRQQAHGDTALLEAVHLIAQAARDAEHVTRSLLTSVHHSAGDRQPIELQALITDVCRILRKMFPALIDVQVEVDDATPSWILGDSTQLRQIVLNLALNARDAMPEGGRLNFAVRPTIDDDWGELAHPTDPHGSFVSLIVTDTGRGMDSNEQSRIFEPFYTTKTRTAGTGLGLSVVHGIVRDHQGTITIRSEVGHGSTFTIMFPRIGAVQPERRAAPPNPGLCGAGRCVLLAEDNATVGELIQESMQEAGYEIVRASDGASALILYNAEKEHIDAVILDIDLPKRSGLDCLDDIRKRDARCPVILITGDPSVVLENRLDPQTALLPKPFNASELATLTNHMLAAR